MKITLDTINELSMELIILTYVSMKFIDQFIKEEGYGRLKKIFFPKKKYKDRLILIIFETIKEFELSHDYNSTKDKFPFYHSKIIFEKLNKYLLFENNSIDYNELVQSFKQYPKIIIPKEEELNDFYSLLSSKIETDKQVKKLFIDENYKSKIYDLAKKLSSIETKIDDISLKVNELHSELIFNPDKNWFNSQCNQSIIDLGSRYTSELNFELPIMKIFEGLGRTSEFKNEITTLFDDLLIKGEKIPKSNESIQNSIDGLNASLKDLLKIFSEVDFESNNPIPFDEFFTVIGLIKTDINRIEDYFYSEERKIQEEKKDYNYYHKYGYEIRNVREFTKALYDFEKFLNNNICQLANNPFLILSGEAGIGKSHMLGDIVTRRLQKDYDSIFLLGQHFNTDDSPWVQAFKKLQINTTSKNFLEILNQRAEQSKKRIIIFIDAINEGRGRFFWKDNIGSFISEIKKYEYLGLVLSIRSSYKKLIFPKEIQKEIDTVEQEIYGFRNNEYEASKLFFQNYKIQLPNVPLLHPEFQNPLFLKLFCDGIKKSGQNKIPDGIQGISSIINFFIKNINTVLSKPKRFDYSESINLVEKTVSALIHHKVENNLRYIKYEEAIEIVEDTISKYVTKRGTYLDELISEGVFSKNIFWEEANEYEEGIYFSYERFEDHIVCKYLLESSSNIENEFKEGGSLFKYLEDRELYLHKGLIDAFSIQIPEKFNKEFFEIVPHHKDNYSIIESFVNSLLWRKYESINEKSKEYVNDYVLKYQGTYDLFWETMLSVASIPEHLYNANSLHSHLMQFAMADRDAEWTQNLRYKYDDDSTVKRLIDWAWTEDDKTHISEESIKLSSIALAWFHTSTNRKLRDCSTKALVNLLQNRISTLIDLLKLFKDVNDPYVYERLYAVAYGCAVRTNQKDKLPELSNYIFDTIFNTENEIYPHILLRDYARGVIEYTYHIDNSLNIDLSKVRPPYKSHFDDDFPSDDEIDEKYEPKEEGYWGKEKWGITAILESMGVEYGRRSYGDFGRYTFQSALDCWNISTNNLSNLAIKWIIEKYGYDTKKHGKFDSKIGSGRGRDTIPNERIGKKYQWLALYEILAKVSDHYPKYEEYDSKYSKKEIYGGSWNPYVRDIDPTILIRGNEGNHKEEKDDFWWTYDNLIDWNCKNIDWVKQDSYIPSFEKLIEVTDNNQENWLILEGFPEWSEPKKLGKDKWDYARKLMWIHIRSYVVKEEDFEKITGWAIEQNFMGRWMPESIDRYELFNREYYWSPAYHFFLQDYYGGSHIREIHEKQGEFIANASVPVENYRWEEEFDSSKEETLSFMKPSFDIFNKMNLQYSNKEGEFLDLNNDIICFDTSVYNNSKSYFLIKKEPFLKYLKENNLKIFWTILGKKQIIGGSHRREDYIGQLEFSGAYYFNDNEIKGKINTTKK